MYFTRYFIIGLILSMITLAGCQKNGGSKEENLVVETSPAANGQLETPAPGPDFPIRITIKSAMPAGGVTIDITGKPDGGATAFFTVSKSTTTAINDFTITGTPSRVVSVTEITVTSNTKSSNRWTGTYKYSRK